MTMVDRADEPKDADPAVAPPVVDEPTADPEDPAGGGPSDRDALLARLAARGLVRTEPSVRIRDVAGPRPDAPDLPAPTTPPLWESDEVVVAVSDDAEALEPEPIGPATAVRCPSCRSTQQVAIEATGYRCTTCDKVWRWGICTSCSHLSLTIARQESWRCTDCGAYSRSWWRTAFATREAQEVARRKRDQAADRERQRVLAVARRRRWKLIAVGVVAVLSAGFAAVVFTSTDASSPAEQARAACSSFGRLKSDLANGSLSSGEIDARIEQLESAAAVATPEVALAAQRLRDAGRPGTAAFLVASTELSDACNALP